MGSNKKIEVRYYSKTGNTKKLAEAIAKTAGVTAKTIDQPVVGEVDILFLGSSVYAAGVDNSVKEFINTLTPSVKKVVNFSTAAILPSTYAQVKKLLTAKGISVDDKEFHCRGSFKFMHKGKPDDQDLKAAQGFVKELIK
ncbi:MAG: flavodoxin protein [Anaerocolumna sp.]|nr:flavodoxin protein [Anaerocolumna sp.]